MIAAEVCASTLRHFLSAAAKAICAEWPSAAEIETIDHYALAGEQFASTIRESLGCLDRGQKCSATDAYFDSRETKAETVNVAT
ncbi:hypothetical protein [Bradyrhizobium iriomotense]|uniref:hypothetical protein n=1 Tax=Bradyrhizobium iriomotense TaxID=441950 RepID=UPI0024E18343|nr:hypothetical protein [Bradyrhizobium iriomotense]